VMVLVAPIVAEVLFGPTGLSIIDSLLFEIPFYGAGALLIREVVRRRPLGGVALLLLGVAFPIFEEFLVIQTSISPVRFAGAGGMFVYGRWSGVNWVYALWAVGYESRWAIVLPIYTAELMFPDRRGEPWLSTRGLAVTGVRFGLGSLGSWAIYPLGVTPAALGHVYTPPVALVVGALLAIAFLVALALRSRIEADRWVGRVKLRLAPLPLGTVTFGLGALWFVLVAFAFDLLPAVPPILAFSLGAGLVAATVVLVAPAALARDGPDRHRGAIVFGGLLAGMLLGFCASGVSGELNVAAKIVFDGVAVLGFVRRAQHVWAREAARPSEPNGRAATADPS
ncbi:MAG: hypothetical protein ACREC5_07860, partial [Thermoplasmata archaeon]